MSNNALSKNLNNKLNDDLFIAVSNLLDNAKNSLLIEANATLVETNFEIGRLIVDKLQAGAEKAKYGSGVIRDLSKRLQRKYSRGYSVDNLERMRKFYLIYKENEAHLRKLNLSWSHYLFLIKIKDERVRIFYERESKARNWELEELEREFNSGLYERLALSINKEKVLSLAEIEDKIASPKDLIKNNYVLEFITKDLKSTYSESDLEKAIINNIEKFMLELGKGFSFVARQYRIGGGPHQQRIDLVFYNRLLQSHFLIDLKIGELTSGNIGQMLIYKKYFDDEIKLDWENNTVGLVLAYQRDEFIVKYMPEDEFLFTSEYKLYLPTKEEIQELREEIGKSIEVGSV
ncbi:MAG: PDDEXK nuclease domain-containing protein [Patescibacteria group bacterium]